MAQRFPAGGPVPVVGGPQGSPGVPPPQRFPGSPPNAVAGGPQMRPYPTQAGPGYGVSYMGMWKVVRNFILKNWFMLAARTRARIPTWRKTAHDDATKNTSSWRTVWWWDAAPDDSAVSVETASC